jgi:hypothetical protein
MKDNVHAYMYVQKTKIFLQYMSRAHGTETVFYSWEDFEIRLEKMKGFL